MNTGSGLRIGQVADATGITVEAIRYYEREGLLLPADRTSTGYRKYRPEAVRRLKFVKSAQALGFSLREIRELLELRVNPDADCGDVKAIALAKIAEIDAKIEELAKLRDALKVVTDACSGSGPTGRCVILEAMDTGVVRKEGER